MAWRCLCADDSGRDDSVRMGGKSCDYLFFDELYYILFHDTKYEPVQYERDSQKERISESRSSKTGKQQWNHQT